MKKINKKKKYTVVDINTGNVVETAGSMGMLFKKLFNIDCFIEDKKSKLKGSKNV